MSKRLGFIAKSWSVPTVLGSALMFFGIRKIHNFAEFQSLLNESLCAPAQTLVSKSAFSLNSVHCSGCFVASAGATLLALGLIGAFLALPNGTFRRPFHLASA